MSIKTADKRIAKNAIYLYLRMFFSLFVSLYTSRIVLQTLGVEDFGIYNVVAGVVSLFSFLNASMSGATARFISYEIGRGNLGQLQKTFSVAVLVHYIISLIVLILAETLGVWLLNTQLTIPNERMFAANVIFQFSVLSAILSIIRVPYNASVLAHEKMNVYALIEIIYVILKLLIVWLLLLIPYDKLIIYSLLFFLVAVIIFLTYRVYCKRKFKEGCHFIFCTDKRLLFPMLTFSGWDLYGNASTLARTQGVNILLNMFFGAILNAASGIATQVQGAIMSFAGNIVSAFRPQIVKSYAQHDIDRMIILVNNAIMYTTFLLFLFTIPLLVCTDFILTIWLGQCPPYAVSLCRCVLIFNLFANISTILTIALEAIGKIKRQSLINGSLYLSVIPVAYIAYKQGLSAEFSFVYNICAVCIGMICNAYSFHLYLKQFSLKLFFTQILFKCSIIGCFIFFINYALSLYLSEGWISFFVLVSATFIILIYIVFRFIFDDKSRNFVLSKIFK